MKIFTFVLLMVVLTLAYFNIAQSLRRDIGRANLLGRARDPRGEKRRKRRNKV